MTSSAVSTFFVTDARVVHGEGELKQTLAKC